MSGAPTELGRIRRDAWLNRAIASVLLPTKLRWRLLRAAGMNISPCTISAGVFFGGTDVSIGAGTFVNYGCFFDNYAPITIGRNVRIGPEVMLCTSSHEPGPAQQRGGATTGEPIVIDDGCWLGARVTVLPGVTIGTGCVIAAGALVVDDCKPNGLYAGVPARLVRDLD